MLLSIILVLPPALNQLDIYFFNFNPFYGGGGSFFFNPFNLLGYYVMHLKRPQGTLQLMPCSTLSGASCLFLVLAASPLMSHIMPDQVITRGHMQELGVYSWFPTLLDKMADQVAAVEWWITTAHYWFCWASEYVFLWIIQSKTVREEKTWEVPIQLLGYCDFQQKKGLQQLTKKGLLSKHNHLYTYVNK